MSRKLIALLVGMGGVFSLLILLIAVNFGGVKDRYKEIEPNLDNYSAAEILFLSFERSRSSFLLSDKYNISLYIMKKSIFGSKINILENRSMFTDSFYHDEEFLKLVNKLRSQYETLNGLSVGYENGVNSKDDILSFMDEMEMTLIDLQEIIYKIQIRNFTEVKDIIKDNSGKAEMFAVLSLILLFLMMFIIIRSAISAKNLVKKKNLFISSIYHELASSSQSIIIAADIIEHELNQGELKREARLISYHGNKIIEQSRDIMDYARLDMGELTVNKTAFNINKIVDDAIMDVSFEVGNKFISRKSNYSRAIISDKYKIYRIIVNLLDNANKYTNDGIITLSVKVINKHLCISVKDSGIGFEIKKLKSLYEAFNQGAEKETRQGMGLGLTIIKNYVDALNGQIVVRSVVGNGTSFFLYIPIDLIEE